MSDPHFIRALGEIGLGDIGEVGGKGASLGELTRAGLRVPDGFVVTTTAWERYGAIGDMPAEVRTAVERAYAALGTDDPPVAVRSSAVDEDAATASLAGQQATYLWCRGADQVVANVVRCWESLFAPEAVAYRAHRGETDPSPRMAVVVQRMVDARVAGVMFTVSPTTGDRSVIAINASWGLGAGVVGGDVTPDEYRIDKVTFEIRTRRVVDKPVEYRPNLAQGGTHRLPVLLELRGVACLSDAELIGLARLGTIVEAHYAAPQDIEWAIARDAAPPDDLYLLQSRPETVWRRRPSVAPPGGSAVDYVLRALSARASPAPLENLK